MVSLNTEDLNRTVFISDNLPFLQSLDTESVDLVVIDPPFSKNETFTGTLRPPLSDDERRIENDLLERWDVFDSRTAYEAGIEYPDRSGATSRFEDIFRFDRDVFGDWMEELEHLHLGLFMLIQTTRLTHGDSKAACVARARFGVFDC